MGPDMNGRVEPQVRFIERPRNPRALLPYMGRRITALHDGEPPWAGLLIALGENAHVRGPSGAIREFPLTDTVFAVPNGGG